MRKLFRLPSPSMVVALTALFVALSGVGYAAVVLAPNSVGKKHLKRNAVVSAKVEDESLTGADIDESTLGRVPAADKLDGFHARELFTRAVETTTSFVTFTGGNETTVASIDVRPGTYVLMGKVHLAKDSAGSVYVFCYLRTPDAGVYDTSGAMIGPGATRVSVPLFVTHTFATAGTASITCDPTNPTDAEVGTSSSNRLLAVKVRSVDDQTPD